MKLLRCVLLAAAFCLWQIPASAKPPAAWGYVAWWMPDGWRNLPLAELDRILFFEMAVDASGQVIERHGWPERWEDLRVATRMAGASLDLTIRCFDAEVFNTLFTTPDASAKFLEQALVLANDGAINGLQLDVEIYTAVTPEAIAGYQRFVRDLATRLHQLSPVRQLSVFFPVGSATVLYDPATLQQFDHVVLQGYDAHVPGSRNAGPIAPLEGGDEGTWRKSVAQGLGLGVPRDHLLLGFPLYGVEWPVISTALRSATSGEGVHVYFSASPEGTPPLTWINARERIRDHGVQHEPVSGSSYYQFEGADGSYFEGWLEDAWSIARKTDYVFSEQLGGIAFFVLGYDQGELVKHFLNDRNSKMRPVGKPGGAASGAF